MDVINVGCKGQAGSDGTIGALGERGRQVSVIDGSFMYTGTYIGYSWYTWVTGSTGKKRRKGKYMFISLMSELAKIN